jgi:hypothetical protein
VKELGSLAIAVLVGIVAIWLFIKLLGVALKLAAILIGIGLAVVAFLFIERLIKGGTAT